MSATTFINTKAEAKIATTIAHEYGFTSLTIDSLYKRYISNVFSAWSNDSDARAAQVDIRREILERRNEIAANRKAREDAIKAQREAEAKADNTTAAQYFAQREREAHRRRMQGS